MATERARRPAPAAAVPALAALQQEATDPDGRAVTADEEPVTLGEEGRELEAAAHGRSGADDACGPVVAEVGEAGEVEHEGLVTDGPLRPAVPA